ncbi:MAG: hypothetical protein RIS86_782 [Planctomycetota bacterium]|jgi:Lon protease-like protein
MRGMSSVRLDFTRPVALFPLPSVALFPHTAEWLVAFEPRYRQMVEDCLRARGDGPILDAAPIAMATYAGRGWSGERMGDPALRPVACIAKIVEHRLLDGGRHRILLHGVCRAAIRSVAEPDGRRLYRLGRVEPLEERGIAPRRFPALDRELGRLLDDRHLRRLHGLDPLREWISRGSVPTEVVVEHLLSILSRGDGARYGLLAEARPRARSRFVLSELSHIARLLGQADGLADTHPSRGVTLN